MKISKLFFKPKNNKFLLNCFIIMLVVNNKLRRRDDFDYLESKNEFKHYRLRLIRCD